MKQVRKYKHFINGRWHPSHGSDTIDVVSAATGKVVAIVPAGTPEDIDSAVSAARTAFGTWSATNVRDRSQILRAIAEGIKKRFEELLQIEVSEVSRPINEMRTVDVSETIDCFEFYASAIRVDRGYTIPVPPPFTDIAIREPLGVIGQIIPWNFPLNIASWKIAPALAMGNCVVVKPSEIAPSSTLELAAIATEAGLPPGVLNVVTGYGIGAGKALVEHVDVDMIAFTGSSQTGRAIAETAGRLGKRVALELGGKSAQIVFDDADFEAAVAGLLEGAFFAQGQNCCAGSRLIVEKSGSDKLITALTERASKLKIGDPFDTDTQISCVVSSKQCLRVNEFINDAKQSNATVVTCGSIPKQLKGTAFVAPTLVIDPSPQSKVVQEEVFGPVLVVQRFSSEDEAISLANSAKYDLAASIWTSNISRAARLTRRLRAGTVWVNTFNRVLNDAPFGGVRWSGNGKDLGIEAMHQYSFIKNIMQSGDPGSDKWF